jgi:hypothetical protein
LQADRRRANGQKSEEEISVRVRRERCVDLYALLIRQWVRLKIPLSVEVEFADGTCSEIRVCRTIIRPALSGMKRRFPTSVGPMPGKKAANGAW